MTRDEAVALIKQHMGFRRNLDSEIVTNMQLVQTTLEYDVTKPWFLREERSHIFTTSGEERIPIPNDFVLEVDQASLRYIPSDGSDSVELQKADVDTLDNLNLGSGSPLYYTLDNAYFRLYPTPDDSYRIRMIYYEQANALSTNIENAWLKHVPMLLIGETGILMSGSVRDETGLKYFERMSAIGRKILHSHDVERELANTAPQRGGAH